tara:strand:+ start:69 stop:773 length:705 start_codon:yes stop_codon:yes gene_type:complete
MAILNLKLKKESHGSTDVDNLLDRNFSSFNQNSKEQDIKTLFTLYDEVYYDLPKQGEQSHTSLFIKSRDFIRNFVDPKDSTIFAQAEEIAELNEKILELEIALLSGSALPDIDEFEEDVATALEFPDENNDDIDDRTQRFSNYGTPRRLILEPSSDSVRVALNNPDAAYYKDEFYGREILKWKKRGDAKDKIVVYDGARGKKGKRYLVDVTSGKSYKIPKRHWKSKNYDKKFKP